MLNSKIIKKGKALDFSKALPNVSENY